MMNRIREKFGELAANATVVTAGLRQQLEPRVYEALSTKVRPTELAALMTKALGIKRRPFEARHVTFYIDPVSNFGFRLFKDGVYEPETIEILESVLEPGDTFVDLGANEGYFSVLASRLVGDGRVFAIEPQQRCWPVIVQNMVENDCANVTLVPYGVSKEAGSFEMVLTPPTNTGASSFVASKRASLWPRQDHAWFCGENGEYFSDLFSSLGSHVHKETDILMVLFGGCDMQMIKNFAADNGFILTCVRTKKNMLENNFIFKIEKKK